MKAHLFDPTDPISIMGFQPAFKHACDMNRIHEGAAMWVLLFFVKALASNLNSHLSSATNNAPAVTTVQLAEPLKQKKLLWSYPKVVNYLPKMFTYDQAIAKVDFAYL